MNMPNPFIPYGKQSISSEDIEAVVSVLTSSFLTQGPLVPQFEQEIANYVGSKYSVAVNSATSALHIACLALGLRDGDIVWTSSTSFVASSNCALYCGATVDFVDISLSTGHIDIEKLEAKLSKAKKANVLPKILIPVHLTGSSCDMESIHRLSKAYGFRVIEDASHAIGGKYQDSYVGCCKYSDICIFSFHPVKIITTGEGGMALTNDLLLEQRMRDLQSHGITKDLNRFVQTNPPLWAYEQQSLGYNYRMTEMQGALGISQLKLLNKFVSRRNILFERYVNLFSGIDCRFLTIPKNVKSSVHLAVLFFDNITPQDHRALFEYLRARNIGVQLHYSPIHLQPYYLNLGFKQGDFPNSELYATSAISLPIYPDLSFEDQDYVLEQIKSAFEKHS